ncbi:MAG: DUF2520 domain-containing protein [Chloroflexi bacterium]|nr:DUF2520 domain-containing protein [Chloroflexota bacterium]MYK60386.1 DUF2520 domain-containing protein [Chloroflexota bacterium]
MAILSPKIGIIGTGRVGSSFATATYPDGKIVATSSRRPEHRTWLSSQLSNVAIVDQATKVAELADIVFITTSDAAIKPVCDSISWQPHHNVIHCSGALTLSVLESAANAGASVAGFHPLQTFPGYTNPDRLSNIAYAIDCNDEALTAWLQSFADAHHSNTFTIQGETAHAAYHASAVLACGLLAGLVGISAELWQHADIDRDQALKLLAPILKSTIEAIADDGLPDAISGPYVRGDLETIRKHLEITSEVNPDTSRAYSALALAQLHIANEKGNLDEVTLSTIKRLLSGHLETL